MRNFAILMVSTVLLVTECAPKVDIEAEKTAVRAMIDKMEKAFETNDPELLAEIISKSPDNVFFGTDAAERWVGFDNFIEAQKQFFATVDKGSEITFHNIVLGIGKAGDTAWMSSTMDWKGTSQGEPFTLEGLRMTAVMEKQDGKWVIVQMHGSVPVSGQAIEY